MNYESLELKMHIWTAGTSGDTNQAVALFYILAELLESAEFTGMISQLPGDSMKAFLPYLGLQELGIRPDIDTAGIMAEMLRLAGVSKPIPIRGLIGFLQSLGLQGRAFWVLRKNYAGPMAIDIAKMEEKPNILIVDTGVYYFASELMNVLRNLGVTIVEIGNTIPGNADIDDSYPDFIPIEIVERLGLSPQDTHKFMVWVGKFMTKYYINGLIKRLADIKANGDMATFGNQVLEALIAPQAHIRTSPAPALSFYTVGTEEQLGDRLLKRYGDEGSDRKTYRASRFDVGYKDLSNQEKSILLEKLAENKRFLLFNLGSMRLEDENRRPYDVLTIKQHLDAAIKSINATLPPHEQIFYILVDNYQNANEHILSEEGMTVGARNLRQIAKFVDMAINHGGRGSVRDLKETILGCISFIPEQRMNPIVHAGVPDDFIIPALGFEFPMLEPLIAKLVNQANGQTRNLDAKRGVLLSEPFDWRMQPVLAEMRRTILETHLSHTGAES